MSGGAQQRAERCEDFEALADEIHSYCLPLLCGPEDTPTAQAADYALQALNAARTLVERVEAAERNEAQQMEWKREQYERAEAALVRVGVLEEALAAAEYHIQDDGPESYEAWQKARAALAGSGPTEKET